MKRLLFVVLFLIISIAFGLASCNTKIEPSTKFHWEVIEGVDIRETESRPKEVHYIKLFFESKAYYFYKLNSPNQFMPTNEKFPDEFLNTFNQADLSNAIKIKDKRLNRTFIVCDINYFSSTYTLTFEEK